jgi:hypothetical protein
MPVLRPAPPTLPTQHQDAALGRHVLVVREVSVDREAIPGQVVRPMALLAGVARRAEVVHRGRNRLLDVVEENGRDLPQARQLRLQEPLGPVPDVALDTGHTRVR